MTPEFAYFMKVNVAFILFYAFYRLFFYKDTFFKLRRFSLLLFFGLALFYPLLNIQEWVRQQEPIADVIYMYSTILPDVGVGAANRMNAPVDWLGWMVRLSGWAYWLVVVSLCGRFLIQLVSILWLARSSGRKMMGGIPVYTLNKPAGPFSFFRMVFLHADSHTEKETEEILAHEHTHVSQWHSVDVVLSELTCIFCWFNPFIWLLKREVRHNLEYLADNTVIQSGYDSRSYQYHLLGLAHQQSVSSLYNNFNVLHLKNRILMMNKKRSHGIGRAKYLMFLPLAGMLMVMSNIEEVARITGKLTREMIITSSKRLVSASGKVVNGAYQSITSASVVVKGGTVGAITDLNGDFTLQVEEGAVLKVSAVGMKEEEITVANLRKGSHVILYPNEATKSGPVFTVVEEMPRFPGGDSELLKFVAKNIKYPKESIVNEEQGRVICAFVVKEDGSITDAEVIRGVTPLLDAEAIRVIKTMPIWTPGKQRGKEVSVKYTIPITFRIQSSNSWARKDPRESEPVEAKS